VDTSEKLRDYKKESLKKRGKRRGNEGASQKVCLHKKNASRRRRSPCGTEKGNRGGNIQKGRYLWCGKGRKIEKEKKT